MQAQPLTKLSTQAMEILGLSLGFFQVVNAILKHCVGLCMTLALRIHHLAAG
jgi:hypothetical protein